MKELTIEQKAKAYDVATERLRNAFYDDNNRMCEEYRKAVIKVIEPIFPELRESEDERIRKEIVELVMQPTWKTEAEFHRRKELIAWLEKQGEKEKFIEKELGYIRGYREEALRRLQELEKQAEQNPMNKNKHKFHEGDWIVFNNHHDSIYQVEKIENYEYTLRHFLGGSIRLSFSHEDMIRTWTLKDARDGDVLAEDSCIFIIKKLNHDSIAEIYCCLFDDGDFETNSSLMFAETSTYPAAKEQRDLLFQKMHEAGYEWDADRKELRKIENEIEIPFGAKDSELQEVTYYIPQGFHAEIDDNKVVIKKGEKPTAWSEEDERTLQGIWDEILANKHNAEEYEWETYDKFLTWLKSLRPQPKQGWSEEDEDMFNGVIETEQYMLDVVYGRKIFAVGNEDLKEECTKELAWLKSLKDRIK